MYQTTLPLASSETMLPAETPRLRARSGAFVDNMRLPVHRWFRYSAGFSAQWAEEAIARAALPSGRSVYDPFVGSGTTLLAAQRVGIASLGLEAHPFVRRVAEAKLRWSEDALAFAEAANTILAEARRDRSAVDSAPVLLGRCYTEEALVRLQRLRRAVEARARDALSPLLWLALTAILRESSGVGTAQWQYLLPNKTKTRVSDPFAAFAAKTATMRDDMAAMREIVEPVPVPALVVDGDARAGPEVDHDGRVGLVLTSPPYPNNYDYADATRLEMTFWGELSRWGDLHAVVRRHLVTSCSQHSAAERIMLDDVLDDPLLVPIVDDLAAVCRELAVVREEKGGKKTYHTMVAAYFRDMARVWRSLRRLCASDARVCMVVGDSAPYGVHVPVDAWMARLAVAEGFAAPRFEKLRDRNVKWKNRKHDVPLLEGRLWVEG